MPAAAPSVPLRALPVVAFKCPTALATSTLPCSAQICVLWPLQLYMLVHKHGYFGHFKPTFQRTNVCTSAGKG
jgi:hypothetical protein